MLDQTPPPASRDLVAVALVSASLLLTELALTRIFSAVMRYHFAFLAISVALCGLSVGGALAHLLRQRLKRHATGALLACHSAAHALGTLAALFFLVRLESYYANGSLVLLSLVYFLAAVPFFTGGLVIALAVSRFSSRINAIYAADLAGAAAGCLALIPLLDWLGPAGAILSAAAFALTAATLFAPAFSRARFAALGAVLMLCAVAGQLSGIAGFDIQRALGYRKHTLLFSKWNSFSRVAVYQRKHGDWSLSSTDKSARPKSLFMDIDSSASMQILGLGRDLAGSHYIKHDLTGLAYYLKTPSPEKPGFSALVIGPGGGRDIVSALAFGARRVDGVEINPIIANDVMRGRFEDFSGGLYRHPRVHITVDDGRSFLRRTPDRYDVIQASLVDTWAATASGAFTLAENSLYTVEAFNDYLDHLNDDGILTITRWVPNSMRLISLAQEACQSRGWAAAPRLALIQNKNVLVFLLKKTPFSLIEIARLREASRRLAFNVLYLPGSRAAEIPGTRMIDGVRLADFADLIRAKDRRLFYDAYAEDISPVTDDRPFFFHTAKLKNILRRTLNRHILESGGSSALLMLLGFSALLVAAIVLAPLRVAAKPLPRGWLWWLAYFGALGAGFMIVEVAMMQRFVLLLGNPTYSLSVTLFSLLLGTGLGSLESRRLASRSLRSSAAVSLLAAAAVGPASVVLVGPIAASAAGFPLPYRMAVAAAIMLPIGMTLGIPLPTGMRLLAPRAPQLVTWTWAVNSAVSVFGATAAIFLAMNWGFRIALLCASAVYLGALLALTAALDGSGASAA